MSNGVKINGEGTEKPIIKQAAKKETVVNHTDCRGSNCHRWGDDFARKILLTLSGVVLVYGIFFLGTLIRNNIKKYDFIGKADLMERTITVNGFGKITGANDIAVTTLGYSNIDKSVAQAQADNKKVMDSIMTDLKALRINDKDLQSDYSIFPEYNYTQDKGQELKGYRVTSRVTVKVRDLSRVQEVLSLAGKYGANEVSGLSFTIDDPQNLKSRARDKALLDARRKAERLAMMLGVRLVSVTSYAEYDAAPPTMFDARVALGAGGGASEIQGGSKEVEVNAIVTYEIAAAQ